MATLPTPNDLTRQQLDELDALLQRMLSLPLNKSDIVKIPPAPPLPLPDMPVPATRPSVSLWRSDSTPATKSPYIASEPEPAIAFEPSFANAAPDPVAIARSFAAPTQDYAPAGGPGTLRGVDAPATPYGYQKSHYGHDSESASAAGMPNAFGRMDMADVNPFADSPPASQFPEAPRSGVPFFAWPVVGANWLIESTLAWMGPLGAVTRTPALKHLLGVAGLALVVGAGLWSAKGMGWVHWPR